MLNEFRVDNFLSWLDLSFQPGDTNLLIGLNNSGKTNLCYALSFLRNTAHTNESTQIRLFGKDLKNFNINDSDITFKVQATLDLPDNEVGEYEYELVLTEPFPKTPESGLEVKTEKLTFSSNLGFDNIVLLDNSLNGVKLLNEIDYLNGHENYFHTTAPRDTTILQKLYDVKTNKRVIEFKSYLLSWQYYNIDHRSLRKPYYQPNEFFLKSDGSNLASVILRLKKTDERTYRKLLENLRILEPELEVINFVGGDTEPNVFMYFEYKSGETIPAWLAASSGTLRFLALAYVLTAQLQFLHKPLIIIEEPENGIYVGHLKTLLELLSESPNAPQVIFTSHSPYFIDLFDEKLENVFVTKMLDKHRSKLSSIDVEKTKKHLSDFSLGEQHFREMLI